MSVLMTLSCKLHDNQIFTKIGCRLAAVLGSCKIDSFCNCVSSHGNLSLKTSILRRINSFVYLFLTDILVRNVYLYSCFSGGDIQTRLYFLCLYWGTVVCACVLFGGLYWI